jgi:hypothetical protein
MIYIHHKTMKASPIENSSMWFKGNLKLMSSPNSLLNITKAPSGNERNIMPKITDSRAE